MTVKDDLEHIASEIQEREGVDLKAADPETIEELGEMYQDVIRAALKGTYL